MYKNSIEKISTPTKALQLVKYFILGVVSWLKVWLNKCNYMEYIYRVKLSLRSSYKALVCGDCQGTISAFTGKGTSERENELDTDFFNLVKSHWYSEPSLNPYVVVARSSFLTRLKLG